MTLSLTFQEVRSEVICNLPNIPFPRRPISSADILEEVTLNHVSSLLEACSTTAQWTTRARIYCLLLLIGLKGHEPVCLAFLDDDFDDLLIPFSIATVPLELSSDAEICKRFLELQPIVATRPTLMRFGSSKAPAHKSILHGDLHFVRVRLLGQNGASTIDLVANKHSGLEFSRKTISRGAEEGERRFRAKQFRNEITALRKVSQNHLVKCVGTYTDQTSYAMILEPVADYNLKALLVPDDESRVSKSDLAYLPEYFGCLAMAVAFLHANELRCNDIKPGNILIHHGRLLLCEFGISGDWTAAAFGRTTTSGAVLGATMPYSAPEVRLDGTCNESSDIWSLGRVYVEMITVLSGHCVEDFDNFISIDNSGSHRKGSSGRSQLDRINDWLEQTRASGDLYELRTVISKMIIREPGNRPTASSVLASIRSASRRFECSVCARSEIPASPVCALQTQVDEEQVSTQPGAPHHPLIDLQASARWSDTRSDRKLSFQAPASVSPPGSRGLDQMRSSHGRHDSMASHRGESFDYSVKSETLTRHDSRQESLLSNSETWEKRDDEVLDIETTLLSYSIDQGEPTSKWKESGLGDGNLKLMLYRTECEQPWEVTRRLVMIDPDAETQTTRIFSYWLPLADLILQIYDDTVVMSWSDCNHDQQEPTRNYVETHSKKYNAKKPNNKIVLKVASSATATSNSIALVQALCSPLAYTGQAARQPDRQIRLMSGERVGIFKVSDPGQGDVMMIVGNLAQGATTKIYSIPPHLDLTVAMRTDQAATIQLYQAVVSGLLVTSYASDAQNLSKMMNKKGCFRKAIQVNRKAVFTFSEDLALFNFLEAVTGWNLVFLARLKSLKAKRTLTHDCGPADMLLWQKGKSGRGGGGGGGDIAMTFRLHSDNANEKWISGLVPRDEIIKKVEGVEASVSLQSPSSGDVLERKNMRAFSTKSHKASSSTNDKDSAKAGAEQISKFKIVFNDAQDLAEFQSVIHDSVLAVLPPTTSLAVRSSRGST